MRKVYVLAGLLAVAAGLAGWAEFGRAQSPVVAPAPGEKFGEPPILPEPGVPMPGKTGPAPRPKPIPPVPKPLPVNEPLVDTLPAVMPPLLEPIKDIAPIAPVGDLILPLAPVKSPVESLPDIKAPLVEAPSIQPLPAKPAAVPTSATVTQESAVSLEWVGPAAPKVGSPADYTVTVKNTCPISLQKVVVQVRIPAGVKVESTEPKADGTDAVLLWDVGTLMARQEKPLRMRFIPTGKGEMSCQAWVTFTGMATLKVQVRDPKLTVKARAPEKVAVGEPANIVLTVNNPGDGSAEHVKLTVTLGAGLECGRGNRPTFDVGSLASGESRAITVPCIAKSAGAQQCNATVEADGGLTAADAIAITTVAKSRIDVAVTGPKLRYVDRKAVYAVKVTNSGDAPATNVFVTQAIPTGFKFVAADNGGQHDAAGGTVKWFVGEIAAGATQEVKAELVAIAAGEFTHKVAVTATGDLRIAKEVMTRVEGVSALLVEVVDSDDPVEVGAATTYQIRVTNTGSKTESAVKLVCTIPPQLKFKSATGPVEHAVVGMEVAFQPLKTLAPRASATFKVITTAAIKGDARFTATLTATGLTEPVTKQESTRVYED